MNIERMVMVPESVLAELLEIDESPSRESYAASELRAAMEAAQPDAGEPVVKYRERSNHDVIRREQSQPCYCWDENDHRIGEEVTAPPANATLAGCEPVEIEVPTFSHEGMGCGLEDRGITDLYEAMEYGYNEALEQQWEIIKSHGPLFVAARGHGLHFSTTEDLASAIRQASAYEDLGPELIAESIFKNAGASDAAHGDEALCKDAERYRHLRDITEGLDATVDAMIAEEAAMRAQAGEGVSDAQVKRAGRTEHFLLRNVVDGPNGRNSGKRGVPVRLPPSCDPGRMAGGSRHQKVGQGVHGATDMIL